LDGSEQNILPFQQYPKIFFLIFEKKYLKWRLRADLSSTPLGFSSHTPQQSSCCLSWTDKYRWFFPEQTNDFFFHFLNRQMISFFISWTDKYQWFLFFLFPEQTNINDFFFSFPEQINFNYFFFSFLNRQISMISFFLSWTDKYQWFLFFLPEQANINDFFFSFFLNRQES